MKDHYTTTDVADTFEVSQQTVKNWCAAFERFLSPAATPGKQRRRLFNADDLEVFALVHDFHDRGYTYEDAEVALSSGQRGVVPDTQTLTPTVPPAALIKLREEMVARENLIRELTSERDRERGKVEQLEKLLKEQIADKDKQIRQLLEELADIRAAQKYKNNSDQGQGSNQ